MRDLIEDVGLKTFATTGPPIEHSAGCGCHSRRRGRTAASEKPNSFCRRFSGGKRKRGLKFPADEFGFSVDPELAREFRDIRWKIACLPLASKSLLRTRSPKRSPSFRRVSTRSAGPPTSVTPQNTAKKNLRWTTSGSGPSVKGRASNVIFSPDEDMEEATSDGQDRERPRAARKSRQRPIGGSSSEETGFRRARCATTPAEAISTDIYRSSSI